MSKGGDLQPRTSSLEGDHFFVYASCCSFGHFCMYLHCLASKVCVENARPVEEHRSSVGTLHPEKEAAAITPDPLHDHMSTYKIQPKHKTEVGMLAHVDSALPHCRLRE